MSRIRKLFSKIPKKRWKRNKLTEQGFSVNSRFLAVKQYQRLTFLVSHLKLDQPDIPLQDVINQRKGFNANRLYYLPMNDKTKCYLCGGKAHLRHHVVPLAKGGKNKVNNIVPLCHPCHIKVHPHMQKGYIPVPKPVKIPVLGPPKQLIVVIPPPRRI